VFVVNVYQTLNSKDSYPHLSLEETLPFTAFATANRAGQRKCCIFLTLLTDEVLFLFKRNIASILKEKTLVLKIRILYQFCCCSLLTMKKNYKINLKFKKILIIKPCADYETIIGYNDLKTAPVSFLVTSRKRLNYDTESTTIPFDAEVFNLGGAMNRQTGVFTSTVLDLNVNDRIDCYLNRGSISSNLGGTFFSGILLEEDPVLLNLIV